ncbi:hypothetical protein BC939DRAFT_467299 [Gamsiella multidivaricata]|uniref:uncharacterized protein n=1 Tax=Gamsiella multidivaricata TaxID=101098 RepID=UPI00221E966F|nr:uncharacterized protein BC939DRAFT_467299 [Gamsiella multidivaricata]KAI7817006.1 hypothetical protein BC939DRAFT_467299 [Gamsiella multidivaricata]
MTTEMTALSATVEMEKRKAVTRPLSATVTLVSTITTLIEWRKEKAELKSNLFKCIRDAVRDSLFSDPYILDTAKSLATEEDQMVSEDHKTRLVFYLKASNFEDWKAQHQISTNSGFSPHGQPCVYTAHMNERSSQDKKEKASQVKARYDYHHRGVPHRLLKVQRSEISENVLSTLFRSQESGEQHTRCKSDHCCTYRGSTVSLKDRIICYKR